MISSLVFFAVALVLLGLIVWAIQSSPFAPGIKWALQAVCVLVFVLWALYFFGVADFGGPHRFGRRW